MNHPFSETMEPLDFCPTAPAKNSQSSYRDLYFPAGKGAAQLLQDLWRLLASSGFSLCSSAKKRLQLGSLFLKKNRSSPIFFRRGTTCDISIWSVVVWDFVFFLGGSNPEIFYGVNEDRVFI